MTCPRPATLVLAAIVPACCLAAATARKQPGPPGPRTRVVLVDDGRARDVYYRGKPWRAVAGALEGGGRGNRLYARLKLGDGDFRVTARLTIVKLDGTAAAFQMGRDYFGFDGRGKRIYTNGRLFGGGVRHHADATAFLASGRPFTFEVVRTKGRSRFLIDGEEILAVPHRGAVYPIGFYPLRATMRIHHLSLEGHIQMAPLPKPPGYSIPTLDVSGHAGRQVVVDREKGQYLGHVTTVLLEDGKTLLAVYPKGHGRGAIVRKRSTDGGLTWSGRLPTPKSWATSLEVPTLYRTVDPKGVRRLIMFSGLYPIRMAVSEDDGTTWSELRPIGDYGGIVAMGDCVRTTDGRTLAFFHDDGRFLHGSGKRTAVFNVYQVESADGGLTWSKAPRLIAHHPDVHLCEPGVVRSPDGKQLAMLFRENSRTRNGFAVFSNDEGRTWTEPAELPGALTGDRHTLRYAPDGRLVCVFRDTCRDTPTPGDFVAWVGTYGDVVHGREGQYRVRLLDNTRGGDCGYPGLEVLPDGTFVATTYGHWTKGQQPYILSVRFKLAELDALARLQPTLTDVFTEGVANCGYPRVRIPAIVCTRKGTLLAFAEGRQGGDHSENDMILRRSTDGGKTWGKIQIVHEDGRNCLNNPCPVVLPGGRVLLLYQRFPHDRHSVPMGKGIGLADPGVEGDKIVRSLLVHSDDDGLTWSRPRDVTKGTKRPDRVTALAFGPGVGIVLRRGKHRGRIVVPCNESWFQDRGRGFAVYAATSDDGGQTWHRGEPAPHDQSAPGQKGWANEVQMVELADGSIRLNSRSYGGAKCRKTAVSRDGGQTWGTLVDDPRLPEPQCMGSILRHTDPLDGRRSRILYVGPASQTARQKGTVRLSYDEGKTWPVSKVLYAGGYAYSCLVALPDGSIGCLFERDGYRHITFARFALEWLTNGEDRLERQPTRTTPRGDTRP